MRLACSRSPAFAGMAKSCAKQSGESEARQDSENVVHVFHPHPVIHIVSARMSVFVQRGRSMLPKFDKNHREGTHNPCIACCRIAVCSGCPMDIKQVPCQSRKDKPSSSKTPLETAVYDETTGKLRVKDMSRDCRQYRTRIMSSAAKLLIRKGAASVAEWRQFGRLVTLPCNT